MLFLGVHQKPSKTPIFGVLARFFKWFLNDLGKHEKILFFSVF